MASDTGTAQASEPVDVLCLIAALHDRLALKMLDIVSCWQSRYRNGTTYSPVLPPLPLNKGRNISSPMQICCLDLSKEAGGGGKGGGGKRRRLRPS